MYDLRVATVSPSTASDIGVVGGVYDPCVTRGTLAAGSVDTAASRKSKRRPTGGEPTRRKIVLLPGDQVARVPRS